MAVAIVGCHRNQDGTLSQDPVRGEAPPSSGAPVPVSVDVYGKFVVSGGPKETSLTCLVKVSQRYRNQSPFLSVSVSYFNLACLVHANLQC